MQIKAFPKPWLIFLGIMALLVIVNIMIIVYYAWPHNPGNHRENFMAGRVSGISPDFITTIDFNKITKTFVINDQTHYIAGRQTITKEDIPLNALVLITPTKESAKATTTIASVVRVLKNNDNQNPHN